MVIQKNQKYNHFQKICIYSFSKIIDHICRLKINEPVERHNPMISPNFESPVYEAEEEENEEIPDEISRLFEQERKTIQPYGEAL